MTSGTLIGDELYGAFIPWVGVYRSISMHGKDSAAITGVMG